jgi:hypothetical protein
VKKVDDYKLKKKMFYYRYLATGQSFHSISYNFYRGVSTISEIIEHTANRIWDILQPNFVPLPTEEKWKNIADRYLELWNLPNCLGALDRKHIKIKCPQKSGSEYFNYKSYFSMVLIACADADSLFTIISVGDVGRNSDSGVLKNSGFFDALHSGNLNIPPPQCLPHQENQPAFPMFFIGDEAFPLSKHIMRPFPRMILTNERRIYNYRISRARKSVECAFGILVSKFRIF